MFFDFFESNRCNGHGRKLLAAGTKATATLPDGLKITGAALQPARFPSQDGLPALQGILD